MHKFGGKLALVHVLYFRSSKTSAISSGGSVTPGSMHGGVFICLMHGGAITVDSVFRSLKDSGHDSTPSSST